MGVTPKWSAVHDEWRWKVFCDYCLEPVHSCGPEGNGEPEAALAATEMGVVPFCSPECRDAWTNVPHVNIEAVADGVGPKELETLLPEGANGSVEWPKYEVSETS